MKDIERRTALECALLTQNRIASDLLKNIEEPHHLFYGARLMACLTGNTLQGLDRRRRHSHPLEPTLYDV